LDDPCLRHGIAVGTVRIWIGILTATGLLDIHDSFAAAFWIAFTLHYSLGSGGSVPSHPRPGGQIR
jgi:hypothetical protein